MNPNPNDAPDRSWIVPGARVYAFTRTDYGRNKILRATKVAKVASQSFTVEDEKIGRVKLKNLQTAYTGSSWNGSRWEILPTDDPRLPLLLAETGAETARQKAEAAVIEWQRGRAGGDLDLLNAAMDALLDYRTKLDAVVAIKGR